MSEQKTAARIQRNKNDKQNIKIKKKTHHDTGIKKDTKQSSNTNVRSVKKSDRKIPLIFLKSRDH